MFRHFDLNLVKLCQGSNSITLIGVSNFNEKFSTSKFSDLLWSALNVPFELIVCFMGIGAREVILGWGGNEKELCELSIEIRFEIWITIALEVLLQGKSSVVAFCFGVFVLRACGSRIWLFLGRHSFR